MTATTKTAKTGVARRADKPKVDAGGSVRIVPAGPSWQSFGILFALVFLFFPSFGLFIPALSARSPRAVAHTAAGNWSISSSDFRTSNTLLLPATSGLAWAGVVLYTVIQVPVMIIAALALAMLIDSYIVKHINAFRLSYFLPYAIPGVVASIIWCTSTTARFPLSLRDLPLSASR